MKRAVVVLLAAAYAAGCVPPGSVQPDPSPDIVSPVDGVVIAVDSSGLTDVQGFTLRVSGGFSYEFELGTLENPSEFPPAHLAEHQATSQPVRVFYSTENGVHTAYRLEDATPPGS